MFEVLEAYYDEKNDIITNKPGLDLHSHDFGGFEGVAKIVDLFGIQVIASLDVIINYMLSKGYDQQKNLFAAPFDWRLAISGLRNTTFFDDLKNLCERAFELNHVKITILGYSLGGMVLSEFLGNTPEITREWKERIVEKVIFLAPAFSGSAATLPISWSKRFPLASFIDSEAIENAIMNMPCLHVLYPNHIVYNGTTVIIKEDNTTLGPESVPDFFIEHGKLQGNSIKMLQKNLYISQKPPADPGVPVLVLYNSKIQTLKGLDFRKGYNKYPDYIYTDGDGTVSEIATTWGCKNWLRDKAIICYDFKNGYKDFDHLGLSRNYFSLEIIFNYTNNYDVGQWHKNVRAKNIIAPMVWANLTTYIMLDNVRQQSEVDD
ncbi:Lecithin:cholesterol acyltransferase family protein [Histomonas meleagridis]|uniref:Lecithin:cholesterol acyltransferase family protein n=1 Tax=Histomonas meleagridis TaxID=135588 RepID=UPI00355973B1|nr:Lecithin:cholesterol acyltransferase family protein [Histomonas meleagridis]KAH0801592.1 Lecithin:cholesterol acyltransferase family protein [Histomonas meleagridis]